MYKRKFNLNEKIITLLIRYYFRIKSKDYEIFIGTKLQIGSLLAIVPIEEIWKREPIKKRIKSIIRFNWIPTESLAKEMGKEISMYEVFGKKSDFGNNLYKLNAWNNSRDWSFSSLEEFDLVRAEGLDSMTILTRLNYNGTIAIPLNLAERIPFMCSLVYPMIIKIPVISFQYFLEIHNKFTFNSIRKSNHPNAENIISYLYEILFIQQKIAISLHKYIQLINYIETQKKSSLLISAEIDIIINADIIFTYLKSSIEKSVVLLGLIFNINNLDSKKTHKDKIKILNDKLPNKLFELYYFKFILEFISSENLDELNNYRSGLLHKRGISDLQPHNYSGEKAESLPIKKILDTLHEQHTKNTGILLGVLALLTDELMNLDPPSQDEILNWAKLLPHLELL